MRKILLISSLFLIALSGFSYTPDEGIWIPLLIEKYNIKLMREKGFRLSAEDIYSVNRACMKDAVVNFNGGCTAELISAEGLLITNHHCGYGQIQEHSSLEHDYLTDGFWAMSKKEELPNPGLSVTILKWMEDVTGKVLSGVTDEMGSFEREKLILKELYANRDYGRYGRNGEIPVCFIANNHTTGGNSGSPVINAEGYLVGINFDRAWEGVASDMAFNPDQSRNISLDIRFALFIIDKFAGAGYLLDEMTIVE